MTMLLSAIAVAATSMTCDAALATDGLASG